MQVQKTIKFKIGELRKGKQELIAKKSVKLEGVSPPMTEVKGIRNTDIL